MTAAFLCCSVVAFQVWEEEQLNRGWEEEWAGWGGGGGGGGGGDGGGCPGGFLRVRWAIKKPGVSRGQGPLAVVSISMKAN